MVGKVVDCGHSVASSVVVKRGGMSKPWALYQLSWSKCCFLLKKLLTAFSSSPSNRHPRHGGYSMLSMSTSLLLFPHDIYAASFVFFSDKQLKQLARGFSACHRCMTNSSRTRTMSEQGPPLTLWKPVVFSSILRPVPPPLEVIALPQQPCNFLDLYQGNILLLHHCAKAIWESRKFKGILAIHCL